MVKLMGGEISSSSTVLHVNWAFVSSFVAKYSRVESVVESPVMGSTWTEVRMETPTQETNNTEKPLCEYHRSKYQNTNLTKQLKKKKKDAPSPSANRGLLSFSHVIFTAGFASSATHVASWRTEIKIKS